MPLTSDGGIGKLIALHNDSAATCGSPVATGSPHLQIVLQACNPPGRDRDANRIPDLESLIDICSDTSNGPMATTPTQPHTDFYEASQDELPRSSRQDRGTPQDYH